MNSQNVTCEVLEQVGHQVTSLLSVGEQTLLHHLLYNTLPYLPCWQAAHQSSQRCIAQYLPGNLSIPSLDEPVLKDLALYLKDFLALSAECWHELAAARYLAMLDYLIRHIQSRQS